MIKGHEVKTIERIIKEEDDFIVVEKFMQPPEDATRLKSTEVDNTK